MKTMQSSVSDDSLSLMPLADRRVDLLLARRASELPDKEYLVFPDEKVSLTFADVAASGRVYGGFLRSIGLESGDHIGLMLPNSSEWVKTWFGAIAIGAVDVGIHNELGGALLQHQLRCARVKVAVCQAESLSRIIEANDGADGLVLDAIVI